MRVTSWEIVMRSSKILVLLLLMLVPKLCPAQCTPGVPDSFMSTAAWVLVPPIVCGLSPCPFPVFCPRGDVPAVVDIFVRDCTGAPLPGMPACNVVLQSNGCRLWSGSPCVAVTSTCAAAPTDATGRTRIRITKAGGCCGTLLVVVQGVVLNSILPYRSYDVDGDGRVGPMDTARVQRALGFCYPSPQYNKCVDFDCAVGNCVLVADLSMYACHLGHFCQ